MIKIQTFVSILLLQYYLYKQIPLIYSGGGSTFKKLRLPYGGFKEIIHVSDRQWRTEAMSESRIVQEKGLCPILSTSYGLSIHILIFLFARNYTSNSSFGVINVACVAGDEVHVYMEDGLAGCSIDVYSNVVSVGMKVFVYLGFYFLH